MSMRVSRVSILNACFSISEIEPKYYADGEDAYAMRRDLGTTFPKDDVKEPSTPAIKA